MDMQALRGRPVGGPGVGTERQQRRPFFTDQPSELQHRSSTHMAYNPFLDICRLYIDGQLSGQTSGSTADGGGPFNLNGSMVLCDRYNGDVDRILDGSLAHLGEPYLPLPVDRLEDQEGTKGSVDGTLTSSLVATKTRS